MEMGMEPMGERDVSSWKKAACSVGWPRRGLWGCQISGSAPALPHRRCGSLAPAHSGGKNQLLDIMFC